MRALGYHSCSPMLRSGADNRVSYCFLPVVKREGILISMHSFKPKSMTITSVGALNTSGAYQIKTGCFRKFEAQMQALLNSI